MNNNELQRIKMAWLAAEEVGDKQIQLALLLDHPRRNRLNSTARHGERLTEPYRPLRAIRDQGGRNRESGGPRPAEL